MIVVDATAAIAWALHEDDAPIDLLSRLAGERRIAPTLWRLEVVNAVLKKERQRLITAEQGARAINDFDAMGVEIVDLVTNMTLADLAALAPSTHGV